jgi:hypothetical protein
MLLLKAHGGDLKVERKVNEMGLLFNFAYYGKVVRGVASPHIVTTDFNPSTGKQNNDREP